MRAPALLLLTLLVGLAACRRGGGRVDAPDPVRDFAADRDTLPDLPAGTIVAPLTLDLRGAVAALEQEVPRRFGNINLRQAVPGSKRKSFAFEVRRDPFAVQFAGDTVLLAAVLHYKGRGWYDPPIGPDINGECGNDGPAPRARLALRVIPHLGKDWVLQVKSRLMGVAPLTRTERDQCQVSFLSIDVTGRVLDAARDALRDVLPQVDRKLARLDIRTPLESIWSDLQQPIRITDSLWLLLRPEAVHLGSLHATREAVGADLGVTAAPRIVTGPRPAAVPAPLPPLTPVVSDEGFSMLVEGAFGYDVMGAALTQRLGGKRVKAPGGRFVVRGVRVVGVGHGRIAVGLDFTGSDQGRIWLTGSPRYDAAHDLITVPDLDFDAGSAGLLVQGVAWIKGDAIREFLRAQARVSAGDLLKQIEQLAIREMNRSLAPGVKLSATIDRTEAAGLAARADALILRARAIGSARLDLGPELFQAKAPGG